MHNVQCSLSIPKIWAMYIWFDHISVYLFFTTKSRTNQNAKQYYLSWKRAQNHYHLIITILVFVWCFCMINKVRTLIAYREQWDIPRMHQHEVNPWLDFWSRENYLYFTLPVALNYQRSSPAMWDSALVTRNDPETHYLFFPELVVQQSFETIQADLTKHKLGLQKNKHTQIWQTLCHTFHTKREDDPRNLIKKAKSCVIQIRNELTQNKKAYPYLNGSKMCDYRMFIMSHYTDIKLQNKHKLSIIPDTHIQQASIVLWVTEKWDIPEIVKEKWFTLLQWTWIHPVDLHSMLRNRSRNNFLPSV